MTEITSLAGAVVQYTGTEPGPLAFSWHGRTLRFWPVQEDEGRYEEFPTMHEAQQFLKQLNPGAKKVLQLAPHRISENEHRKIRLAMEPRIAALEARIAALEVPGAAAGETPGAPPATTQDPALAAPIHIPAKRGRPRKHPQVTDGQSAGQ